ncbi:glycine/betaine ABC transporter substrate-binding protein [Gordonia sp. DT101]|uniref:glycine/betaine ABC transporter substrate-binding protein n=1 Tax=Gordonia sp. DT101 TaxID=3416545 RepID=UPI003CF64ADC
MIKRAATAILMVLALAAVAGCSEADSHDGDLVMGAPNSPSMQVMAQIYAGALRHAGSPVSMTVPRGDYRSLLDDMDATTVDLFPAFSGRLLSELAPQSAPPTADQVYSELNRSLPQGVSVGDATTVSATPQIFVAASVADHEVTDLAHCSRLAPGLPLVVVGDPDGPTIDALSAAGCRFGPVESVPSSSAVVRRVAGGGAVGLLTPLDVAGDDAEGSSGDIRALTVPKSATETGAGATADKATTAESPSDDAPGGRAVAATGPRAEQLVPVYRTAALSRDQVKTINKVAGEMTTADLATLTRRAVAGAAPADLANGWLAEHGL